MSDAIKMTPEIVQAVNELCNQSSLSGKITRLQNAEEALQKVPTMMRPADRTISFASHTI